MRMNITEANKILYEYIVKQYGNVVEFSNKSGISHIDLNAVLVKDNVQKEICIGLNLCNILHIDAEELIFNNEIKESAEIKNIGNQCKAGKVIKNIKRDAEAKNEIHSKCMRLSEIEKKKVLDYINELGSTVNNI